MAFDPWDFFRLSQNLAADGPDESRHRTAIGRAYYACFLVARDQMFGLDGATLSGPVRRRVVGHRRAGSHEVVLEAIKSHPRLGPARGKRISDQLGQLKDMRIQADYYRDTQNRNTISIFTTNTANDWIGLANAALALASNLLPELQRLRSYV